MAKNAREYEQEFIATVVDQTGHTLDTWMTMIADSGENKTNSIIKWIKTTHGLNHMQANILTGIYNNDGKPVYDYESLMRKLFDGKQTQKPLYDALVTQIKSQVPDLSFIPTKTYISLENDRVIGCIKINKSNIRLGLDLGDSSYEGVLQEAKGLGAMPNIAHMIELKTSDDLNNDVVAHVSDAYNRHH